MNWTELTIYLKREAIEQTANCLADIGITSIVIEDPNEMRSFIDENSDKWDLVGDDVTEAINSMKPNIKLYISDEPENSGKLREIDNLLKTLSDGDKEALFDGISTKTAFVKDEDWENNWKEYFKPLTVGEKLRIVPAWEETDCSDGIEIRIDPGTSFGSGMHETTQLCMTALEEYLIPGDTVFDIGSGSGILTVTAAKLGAGKVIATDIDNKAVSDTMQTVTLNGVTEVCEARCSDLVGGYPQKADIIVGNLFADIIIRLAETAKDIINPDGLLITSGIIEERLNEVLDAYEKNGFEIVETVAKGEWYCVVGQNK